MIDNCRLGCASVCLFFRVALFLVFFSSAVSAGKTASITYSPLSNTDLKSNNLSGNSLSGTKTVGGSSSPDYSTLSAAFSAISANHLSGNLNLVLQAGYNCASETYPLTAPTVAVTNSFTITIYPAASGLSISASTAGILCFNGAQHIILDGRVGATGLTPDLIIDNQSTSGNTLQFSNEASYNTIQYCIIKGCNNSSSSGTVFFGSTTGSNGNDNNTIDHCLITAGAATPANAIYSSGSTGTIAAGNSNNTISNCSICDFSSNNGANGILLSTGSTDWSIVNNSFYETASRNLSSSWSAIQIFNTSGNNFLISGNYIGGQAANAGGSAMLLTGGVTFIAIKLSVGPGVATSIQGNTIMNCNLSTSIAAQNSAIAMLTGNFNCGTITGNTIGSMTGTNNLSIHGYSGATTFSGILAGTSGSITAQINNNQLGGISASVSYAVTLNGISIQNTSSAFSVSGNTIGSTTVTGSITNSSGASLYGINAAASCSGNTEYISQNLISNLTVTASSPSIQLIGIIVPGNNGGLFSVTGNQIRNLTSSVSSSNSGTQAPLIGIMFSAGTDTGQVIAGNTISELVSAATSSVTVAGIVYAGPVSGTNFVSGNFIHSLSVANTNAILCGIYICSGVANYQNNMIRLGIDGDGNALTTAVTIAGIWETNGIDNFYHNSVYIGGAGVQSTVSNTFALNSSNSAGIRDCRDNIFMNARSNTTSGGKHYAVRYISVSSGGASDYNIILATGTGGIPGHYGSTDYPTLTAWQNGTGRDLNSLSADPQFINPTGTRSAIDLHITSAIPTPAEGTGIAIAAVTTDFDGQNRAALTPVDIGADAGNFLPPDHTAPVISFSPVGNALPGSSASATAQITDASGVPLSGSYLPRIYYRKNAGTWYSSAGTLLSGTAANGVWSFQITFADFGGASAGDSIGYYFVAQDIAIPPNVSAAPGTGFSGTNVLSINTPTSSPASFRITSAISGNFTVGSSGNYKTLTAAISDYNNKVANGPVTFSLIDALYSTNETFPLVIKRNSGATCINTLTIKPAAGVSAQISGASASSILKLTAAAWVILDGSGNNGSRNVSFINTGTGANTIALWLGSSNAEGSCTNDTVRGCIFSGRSDGGTLSALFSGSGSSIGLASERSASALFMENNCFNSALNGILWKGNSAAPDSAITISHCLIGSASSVNKLGGTGITLSGICSFTVSQDSVCGISSTGTNTVCGILVDSACTGGMISRNQIFTVANSNSAGYGANGICLNSTATDAGLIVANNFIHDIAAYGSNTGANGNGISINRGGGYSIYYNTVCLSTNPTAANAHPACINISTQVSTPHSLSLRNNIFVNNQTVGSPAFAMLCNAAANVFSELDNNDYYVSNPATSVTWHIGSDMQTLASWQSATGKDRHAVSADPLFHTTNNLHILPSMASPVSGTGSPVSGITVDYDCDTRDPAAPDIGADEFTAKDITLTTVSVSQANYSAVLDTVKAGGITIKPSASGNITASFVPQGRAGMLPNGITNVSPYYWLLSTSRTSFNDTVKFYFDHIAGNGINNYSSLRLLRREGDGAPWIEIPTTNKSVRYIEAALSDFSEFALGGGDENPLPVELSSFLANASGTTVKLQWITQSEINTSYFAVERSILKPELQWKTIGQKQAISSGNGAHQYVYADTLLLPGNYIYRLKIVDNDGSFRYGPTAQAVIGLPRNFELQQNYPNPFNPETVICYSLPSEQHVRLKIYSLLGKEVATLKDERQPAGIYRVTFNGLGMAGGVYFYTLKTNSFSRTRKMLLLK